MLINHMYYQPKTSILNKLENKIGYEVVGIKIYDPENGAKLILYV